jgi:hypothetical protein
MALQDLIDAAPDGGTVVVPPGIHRETLVIERAVRLVGTPGASILDGGGDGTVIQVNAPPQGEVVLEGLVIRNGSAQGGAGVQQRMGRLRLVGCVLEDNAADAFAGGGVYAGGQRLVLERCRLERNAGRQGGGLFVDGTCQATLTSCLIAGNVALYGGGIRVREGAQLVLEGCTVADNEVSEGGEGPQLHAAGTSTRAPTLSIRNSILWGGAPVWNQGEFPAECAGSHNLTSAPVGGLSHPVSGDPRFGSDHTLGAGSAAVGQGDPSGISSEAVDLAGHPRVRGGRLDLGALASLS